MTAATLEHVPVTALRRTIDSRTGVLLRDSIVLWCPGCHDVHSVTVAAPAGSGTTVWDWSGDLDNLTVMPSLLVEGGEHRCHAYISAGQWRYLADSSHRLAGRVVDLPALPAWLEDALLERVWDLRG